MTVVDIHNQVRALADPYPNSFSFIDKSKLSIRRSLPIDSDISYEPGTVVDVLSNDSFLIAGKDGMLLVDDYYLDDFKYKLIPGLKLESVSIVDTANLIVKRFQHEFSNKKINQSLIDFWARNSVTF